MQFYKLYHYKDDQVKKTYRYDDILDAGYCILLFCVQTRCLMVISHNMMAMNAQRQFNITGLSKSKSTEKLASGYRVNRAADDAAGLAISEKMRRQIRGLNQGARNTQDGISLLQVADGALSEVHEMLHRMNELAVQAANGTNTDSDREAIQQEIDQIKDEIGRIGSTTEFNEELIFEGEKSIKIISGDDYVSSDISGIKTYYDVNEITPQYTSLSDSVFQVEYKIPTNAAFSEKVMIDGTRYSVGMTMEETLDYVAYKHNLYGTGGMYRVPSVKGIPKKETGIAFRDGNFYTYKRGNSGYVYSGPLDMNQINWYKDDDDNDVIPYIEGIFTYGSVGGGGHKYYPLIDLNGDGVHDGNTNGTSITRDKCAELIRESLKNKNSVGGVSEATVDLTVNVDKYNGNTYIYTVTKPKEKAGEKVVINDKRLWIQSGAENGAGIYITIPHMNENVIGVKDVSVISEPSAGEAIAKISNAIEIISEARSKLGAQQNRLEHTYKNITNVAENTQAAESRIRDTDMSKEIVNLSTHNVLEQVGTSIIAQANQSNQGVLSLLK